MTSKKQLGGKGTWLGQTLGAALDAPARAES